MAICLFTSQSLIFFLVGQMSHSSIGGTNVVFSHGLHLCRFLALVALMSWWDKCVVGQMSVGQMSVAQTSVGQKSHHRQMSVLFFYTWMARRIWPRSWREWLPEFSTDSRMGAAEASPTSRPFRRTGTRAFIRIGIPRFGRLGSSSSRFEPNPKKRKIGKLEKNLFIISINYKYSKRIVNEMTFGYWRNW